MTPTVRRLWLRAKNVLFPVQCAGCGKWDSALCAQCAALADRTVLARDIEDDQGRPDTELLLLGEYDAELRNVILAAKHDPYRDLSDFLIRSGYTLGKAAGGSLSRILDERVALRQQIWIVPAPSSHARRRRRAEIVPDVAYGVARGMRAEITASIRVVPAVRLKKGVGSQEGKSAGSRGRGRAGTILAVVVPPPGALVVLVDDVVTTGATMRAMSEALEGHVVQALALAAA